MVIVTSPSTIELLTALFVWMLLIREKDFPSYLSVLSFLARGGARNFPTWGLTLPTRGPKYGYQGTINAKNLRKKSCSRGATPVLSFIKH